MSQYDDETGLVLSDEDEIAKEAALEDQEDQDEESTHIEAEAQPVQNTAIVPRINKKLILLVAASLASLFVIVSLIGPSDSKKKKAQGDSVASELLVPDFTVQRQPYEIPEDTPPVVQEERPVYEAPPQPAPRPQPSGGGGRAASSDESTLNAHGSTIIPVVQGRLLGQETQGGYRGTIQGQNPALQALSGLGSLPMGQDEYTASRLAALGGMGSPGGVSGGDGMSYREQNMQDDKLAFYNSGRKEDATGQFIAHDTLWNGSIIPGVLITGINTDLPGDVQARVTENIYDSLTGRKLLIPQGSILIASYNSSISFAQERVQIAWNTLIRPDGYQVALGNMNGVDSQGYSGTKGSVNEHLFQYVKAAGIISAFTLVNGEFAATMAATKNETAQNLIAANQNVVNQLGAKIIDRTMNIQPTLTVKSGTKINIMLNKNIQLPPVESPPVKTAYKR
jgi:type IV secretion system protein VirB10